MFQVEGDESTMRVGIVPSLNPSAGGVYQYTLTILEALAALSQQGQEKSIFCLRGLNTSHLLPT